MTFAETWADPRILVGRPKVALVTGGRRGIGLAITLALQAAGWKVAVLAKSADGPGDFYMQVNLHDPEARVGIVRDVVMALGGIDLLVNNAGAQVIAPALALGEVHWDQQIELLLTAPFDLSKQAAAHMLANDGGDIINILSTSAFAGSRNIAAYTAAKHGLLGLTRALSHEWAPDVRVNAVAPGLADTDMTTYIDAERRAYLTDKIPSGRFATPEDVARAVMALLSMSDVYGQVVTVDGGWLAKNG